jgi:prephenate dehydratase
MEAVKEVAEYKSARGLPIEDLEREQSLIENMSGNIGDDKIRPFYVSFLQSTMDISKNWQHSLISGIRVACVEDKYTGGTIAAGSIFPSENITVYETYEEAYKAVENGDCEVAVLPLENSDKGDVGKVYDLLFEGNLHVNSIRAIETEGSTTRYAVISRAANEPVTEKDTERLLVMFRVKDEVGSLAKAINVISAYGYNMHGLRPRPIKDVPWHYYFYVELEGKSSANSEERIVRGLSAACVSVKIVGHLTEDSFGTGR